MGTRARKRDLKLWKREGIVVDFQILDGPFQGTVLERFYSITPRVGTISSFYREWVVAANRLPRRGEHLRASKFCGKLFRVEVATVKKDWNQKELPKLLQYSKVARVLELLASNEAIQ
ncbi:MAG: hypothetical protein ABSA70_08005 [Terriglobia bacterium]